MRTLRYQTTLLLLALVILTACTPASTVSTANLTPKASLVTIKVVGWESDSLLDLLMAAFQEQHPEYRVEKVPIPYRSSQGQILALAREKLADILPLSLSGATALRAVIPLDPFIARSGLDVAPYGSALDQLRWEGQLKELPFVFIPTVLVYHADLVKAAGVTIPEEAWTWDELRVVARQLTRDGDVMGLVASQPEHLVRAWIEGKTGLPPWEVNPTVVDEALQFFGTLTFADRSLNTAEPGIFTSTSSSISSRTDIWDRFLQQRAAIMATSMSPSALDSTPEPNARWEMTSVPAFPGSQPLTMGHQRSLSILESSSQPDAAWEFIRFAGGPEGAAVLAAAGHMPMYRGEAALSAFERSPWAKRPGVAALWRSRWQLTGSEPSLSHQQSQRHWAYMKAVNLTLSGAKSREEAMAEFRQATGEE